MLIYITSTIEKEMKRAAVVFCWMKTWRLLNIVGFRNKDTVHLKVKSVPMSSWESSSALDFGYERRYRSVSKAGTTKAFLALAMSSCTTDFLQTNTDTIGLHTGYHYSVHVQYLIKKEIKKKTHAFLKSKDTKKPSLQESVTANLAGFHLILFLLLPEVLIQAIHGQEVDVR